MADGAIGDGTTFVSLLTGERATVTGGRLPLASMAPGVAMWTTDAGAAGMHP